MYTLGIGGSNHDFSAALVKDGELIVAIEDERINRIKHGDRRWMNIPSMKSVEYCLDYEGITIHDVDQVYTNNDLENIDLLQFEKVTKIGHHLAHACTSYFLSPFKESCLFVADGCGGPIMNDGQTHELETISIGTALDTEIDLRVYQSGVKKLSSSNWTYRNSNSLGVFYRVISEGIGFSGRGEGKTMGLAAYGNDELVQEMRKFITIEKDQPFEFDPYCGIYDWMSLTLERSKNSFQTKANLAYAAQSLFEQAVIEIAKQIKSKFNSNNLCLGGGCALNCSANGKLRESKIFDNIYVYPPAGDNGLAIGAAFYGDSLADENRKKRTTIYSSSYTGKEYSDVLVKQELESSNLHYYSPEDLIDELTHLFLSEEILAICRGRSEIGPRALGNRSILASPFNETTRDRINLFVKKRESFRPLAPMVLEEDVSKYFDFHGCSPYMLEAVKVKKEFRRKLKAITHFDGSARIQTVSKSSNPFIYELLQNMKTQTGFGVLLNTSFNERNEPIVETPQDAIRSFIKMPIKRLVLSNYIVEKHTPWYPRELV